MTDNDIIKALNRCCEFADCRGCPFQLGGDCIRRLCKESLDLINRQKAEIERLQGYNDNLLTANTALSNEILDIKFETIKEFAERLKERKYQSSDWSHGEHPYVVEEDDINDILQELTGDQS
jgi:hypothetical protein